MAFTGQRRHDLFQSLDSPRAKREPRTGVGEGSRDLGPDSARGAGDDRGPIRQVGHERSLPSYLPTVASTSADRSAPVRPCARPTR
jgi:hypothetical protein